MAITSGFPDTTTDEISITDIILIRIKSIGILKLM